MCVVSVVRPAEFEGEGCVLWWFILRLLAFIAWSKRSTAQALALRSSFDRLQRLSDVITGCYLLVRRRTRFYYFGVILVFFQLRVLGFCSGTHLVSAPRSTGILGICRSASFDSLAFHAVTLFRGPATFLIGQSSHKNHGKRAMSVVLPENCRL